MNDQKKELNDILKELHKVLDDLSVDTGVKKDVTSSMLEELKNKIKEKEEKISNVNFVLEGSDKKSETDNVNNETVAIEQNLEKKVLDDTNLKNATETFKKIENQNLEKIKQENEPVQTQDFDNKNFVSKTTKEETEKFVIKQNSQANNLKESTKPVIEQPVIEQPTKDESQNVINTIFIYPLSVPESKDIFYEQINNTLKRVSKKPVNIKPVYEISFTEPEMDLVKNEQEILSKIKSFEAKAMFVITNESVMLDDFVSKFSEEVFMVKRIKYSELKTKSIYLDIAIDILLAIK